MTGRIGSGDEIGQDPGRAKSLGEIQAQLGKKVELPSPPAIVVRILEAVQDDDSCFAELGRIIAADPSLTTRLLRVANSSLYGFSGRVKTIENAIAILGINALKNIALSFIIVHRLQRRDNGLFDFEGFWKRSVTTAVAAKTLAPLLAYDSDDIFISGLLLDMGILVFHQCCTDLYLEVLSRKNATDLPTHVVEREILGVCHAELGGALLKEWGLPKSIYLPLFYHHRPKDAPEDYRLSVDILAAACRVSAVYHNGQSRSHWTEVCRLLQDGYGITEQQVRDAVDSVAVHAGEILGFFDLPADQMRPLSELLQEANQELGKLNCGYEQLVMDLKQAKNESRKYVDKLIEVNRKYRELAYRDELTGLFNSRYFQELMDKELARSQRYQHSLGLLFFDIDLFKEINDNFGHLAGDQVLRRVADKIKQTMRTSDIVVRYGGDEFAIIMPEILVSGLKVFAERLRRSIEAMVVAVDQGEVQVTVSIGGAIYTSRNPEIDKGDMLSAADKALYQVKHSGRNRFIVVEL